ncbi:hypothetical protein AZH53_10090 [Methanomicrobiaceae archaeon CYW5]|nr:hypothetical protein [Methanovulcanius yangii]
MVVVVLGAACVDMPGEGAPQVVVYTSVDQVYAAPVLAAFEEQSGIDVLPVYDVEATKTTGLVQRLIAEKEYPQADVFWNGEVMQTVLLKEDGVLAPYSSPAAADIPAGFVDADGYFTGTCGRARVILVNTDRLAPKEYPTSVMDLVNPDYEADDIGLAVPVFGTTSTHAAALYAALGEEDARAYYEEVADRHVRIVDGNSVVRDLVAAGDLAWGMTDTDDASRAVEDGLPVAIIVPDQEEGGLGTLVIPTTVALVAGGPNPSEGQVLYDYLVSAQTEQMLADIGWCQIGARSGTVFPEGEGFSGVRCMNVTADAIYGNLSTSRADCTALFIR